MSDCHTAARCPCAHPVHPLGRILKMGALDGFAVVRGGGFVAVGATPVWSDAAALATQARRERCCLSDLVVDTSSVRA